MSMGDAIGILASYKKPTASGPPLSGLLGWWDASDDATFTFFSGSLIQQWNDKSGSNYHAVTHTANSAFAPTRVAATINGLAAVSFAPQGVINTGLPSNQKPFHAVAAVKTGAASGNTGLLGKANGAGAGALSWDHNNATMRLMRDSTAQIGAATSGFTATTPTVMAVSYSAADAWAHHRNGTAVGTGTTGGTFIATTLSLGGFAAPNIGMYSGHLGEMLFYNRVLDAAELTTATNYLKTKWGIA